MLNSQKLQELKKRGNDLADKSIELNKTEEDLRFENYIKNQKIQVTGEDIEETRRLLSRLNKPAEVQTIEIHVESKEEKVAYFMILKASEAFVNSDVKDIDKFASFCQYVKKNYQMLQLAKRCSLVNKLIFDCILMSIKYITYEDISSGAEEVDAVFKSVDTGSSEGYKKVMSAISAGLRKQLHHKCARELTKIYSDALKG